MPVAYPFSTLGKLNGLSNCVPKVDVTTYDYWITASGYSKEDFDASVAVTQDQIDQSLHAIGRLYWNLYRLELDCFIVNGTSPVSELIIDGTIDQSGTAIQPMERVCAGSQTILGDQLQDEVAVLANLRLGEAQGFARLYTGDTTDEANFIGYALGEAAFAAGKCIDIYVQETTYDAALSLGGYAIDETASGRSWKYLYTEMDNIHMVFVGAGGGGGVTTTFPQDPPTTLVKSGATTIAQAQVTSLEMWEY